jgi:hypothetical protein
MRRQGFAFLAMLAYTVGVTPLPLPHPMHAIDDKLRQLRPELAEAEAEAERRRDAWEEVANRVNTLRQLVSTLEELKAKNPEATVPRRPKPSQAIKMLVTQHPGISMRQILDTLDGKVHTTSTDTRHLLRTTLNNLVREGKITRHADDLYSVPTHR